MRFLSALGERLRQGLRRSQELLTGQLAAVLQPERPLDDALFEELEELLIAADLGAPLAADFVNRAREEVMFGTVTTAVQLRPLFRRFLTEILTPVAQDMDLDHRPAVVVMLGVNGSGKTTTCAKLAASLKGDGQQVILVAADTFRAAAIEQLEAWAKRAEAPLIRQAPTPIPPQSSTTHPRRQGPPSRGGHHRHRRAPPYEGQPDGGAQEDEANHGAGASGRAARGSPRPRRDHRTERHRPGADVHG